MYFCLCLFFQSLQLFVHVYPFSLSFITSTCSYFVPKLFCFRRIRLWECLRTFSPTCRESFLLLFWNALFCLDCLILYQYVFSVPSFAGTFWFICSRCIVPFNCVALRFSYLSIFACCQSFPICLSGQISHSGFQFLLEFFRGPQLSLLLLLLLFTPCEFFHSCVSWWQQLYSSHKDSSQNSSRSW